MSRFERWNLWITSLLVILTGGGLAAVKYLMEPTEPWAVINHALQPWLLKAHIVVSPLMVFAVGIITLRHIWHHYRSGQSRGRYSGIATAAVTVPMILTGYLIQVITDVGWLKAMAVGHIVLGTVYALGLSAHQVAVQRKKPRDIRHEPPRPHRKPRPSTGRPAPAGVDRPHARL